MMQGYSTPKDHIWHPKSLQDDIAHGFGGFEVHIFAQVGPFAAPHHE